MQGHKLKWRDQERPHYLDQVGEGLGEGELWILGKCILGQDPWGPDIHQTCQSGGSGEERRGTGHEMVTAGGVHADT